MIKNKVSDLNIERVHQNLYFFCVITIKFCLAILSPRRGGSKLFSSKVWVLPSNQALIERWGFGNKTLIERWGFGICQWCNYVTVCNSKKLQ